MSAQIDTISERSELGQGSWARSEEIGKASTAILDNRYLFAARSVNLTWPLCVRRSLRAITDESETKTEVKSLFAGFFLLGCGRPWRCTARRLGVFPLQRTNASRNFGC